MLAILREPIPVDLLRLAEGYAEVLAQLGRRLWGSPGGVASCREVAHWSRPQPSTLHLIARQVKTLITPRRTYAAR